MKKEDLVGEKPKKKKNKTDKVLNIILWITGGLCALLAIGVMLAVIILPKKTQVKDVTIPNVTNLTVAEAEKMLLDAGFFISSSTEEKYSSTIPEGKVIGIKNYNVGDVVKSGKTLVIIVSKGTNEITIEDYVGKPYQEIQVILERNGLQVFIEEEPTTDEKTFKEDIIIRQSVEPGTKLTEGDIIRLYIQTLQHLYPDFVNGSYTLDAIEAFCKENGIEVQFKYQETYEYKAGTILQQNPTPGYVIKKGQILIITIAAEPTLTPPTESNDPASSGSGEDNER